MQWYCEKCLEYREAGSELELELYRHAHNDLAHPASEEVNEDTVLNVKYLLWGFTLLAGILSAKWPVLSALVPFAALFAWTYTGGRG